MVCGGSVVHIDWQVRVILDTYGGQAVKVIPCAPAMLHARVSDALTAPEPDWDKPAPQAWLTGSSWGSQRTILFSGLKYAPADLQASCPHPAMLQSCVEVLQSIAVGCQLFDVMTVCRRICRSH